MYPKELWMQLRSQMPEGKLLPLLGRWLEFDFKIVLPVKMKDSLWFTATISKHVTHRFIHCIFIVSSMYLFQKPTPLALRPVCLKELSKGHLIRIFWMLILNQNVKEPGNLLFNKWFFCHQRLTTTSLENCIYIVPWPPQMVLYHSSDVFNI